MNASMSSRSAARAALNARRASASLRASGFSQSTCLPASSARIDQGTCSALGSGM